MTPQDKKVLAMLQSGPLDYMLTAKNGVPKLSNNICQLRKAGVAISHTMHHGITKTGKRIMYAVYTLDEPKHYRRGQRKPERTTTREYTCEVGEVVYHDGRKMMVQEVLENGSEANRTRAFVKGCGFFADGTPAERTNIFAGCDWDRQNDRQK